jgi:beta-galactosidase
MWRGGVLKTIALCSVLFWGLLGHADAHGRTVIPLDDDWRFSRETVENAEFTGFDDHTWQNVDLPHDWAIEGPFDKNAPARGEGGFLPTGIGWYRKQFQLPVDLQGRRILIEFDGAMANSDVWINGQHVGHRPNGYVSFYYDITDHVKHGGKENVLAVRTDTSEQVASRWYTGSGIYRHIRLLAVEPLHIEPWGIAIATPNIGNRSAGVEVIKNVISPSRCEFWTARELKSRVRRPS